MNATKTDLPVLGIETSGELCSVSLMVSEKEIYTAEILKKNIHSEKIYSLIDFCLTSAGIKPVDLKGIAVSSGPGSFTGLRIGFSAAKGIAFGAELPIIPVPTFSALAMQISAALPDNTQFVIANNVNISELYIERFVIKEGKTETVTPLSLIKKDSFNNYIEKEELIFGNYIKKDNKSFSEPSAEFICRRAYLFGKDLLTSDFEYLEPQYLKDFVAKESKK